MASILSGSLLMVKHLTRLLLVTLVLFGVALGAAVFWLHTEVRSLESLRPDIEAALNPEDASYRITYAQANLDWRDWSKLGLLEVTDVQIRSRDGQSAVVARFPVIYVNFSLLGFFTHGRMLHTILLDRPKLLLTRDATQVLRLGLEGDDNAVPLGEILGSGEPEDASPSADADHAIPRVNLRATLPFRKLVVRHARVRFTDSVSNAILISDDSNFTLARRGGYLDANITIPFLFNNKSGSITASLVNNPISEMHVFDAKLAQVPAELACLLASCPAGVSATGMLDGKLALGFDDDGALSMADVNMAAKQAVFAAPHLFAEPLSLSQALLQLQASNGLKSVRLSRLSLGMEDVGFEVTGDAHRNRKGWFADAKARATRPLALPKLYKYWPLILAPASRQWVTESMQAGHGDAMFLNLHMTPPDWDAPLLPDSAIDAGLEAKDITVEYVKGFPLMHHVHGKVHFTGTTVRIEADAGTAMTGTQLQQATILFPDLNKAGTPVEIQSRLHAPAADAATILALKYFPFSQPLKLDSATISGTVDARMALKFDAFSGDAAAATAASDTASSAPSQAPRSHADDVDFSRVIYDISASLQDVAQPKFAGRINLSGVNGKLTANNSGFHLQSEALFGSLMPFSVRVDQSSGADVVLTLDGRIARGLFAQAGLPENDRILEGTAQTNARLTIKKDAVIVNNADINLTDLALAIPELSWSKKRGVPGSISLSTKEGAYHFSMRAADLNIADATAQMDASGNIVRAKLPRISTDKNDFSLTYATRADGYEVALAGDKLDASDSYAKSDNGLLKNFPPIRLTVNLGRLTLVPDSPFTALRGNLQCDATRCASAKWQARLGKGDVAASIATVNGERQLKITASNAGEFLDALNFTDRVHGGALDLRGSYDDRVTPPLFNGRLRISECNVKNSAILGRIFSIASLSGIANALTGSGIVFNKISADIAASAGVLTLKNGKANGNAAGLTVAGTVDTGDASLRLKGVVVPAYALNSLLGNIPLIGALAGGEGEGLIAFNYGIDGTYANPDVHVNPLSGLTPGFLRGIFGIFDSDEKKPAPAAETKPDTAPQE